MDTYTPHNTRQDYLDAVRAFALLLGIVFHACLSFLPVYIGWAVMDISTSTVVGVFALVSHSFRMALFFLLAGFFSHMSYHRKGGAVFLKSRLLRIALPFVLGWILLRPLLVFAWVMGAQSMRGDVSLWPALQEGASSMLAASQTLLTGTHLWFLYYLLLVTLSVLCVRALTVRFQPAYRLLSKSLDAALAWLCHSSLVVLALAVPTAGCMWLMGQWGLDTPDKSLVPHWPVYCIYGGCFTLGWLMHRQSDLIPAFSRLSWQKLLVALTAIVVTILTSPYERQPGHPHIVYIALAFKFSYSVMMWSLIALMIGLFRHYLDRPNKVIRYLADASYWLYLIHLPIVIWLQIAFAEVSWHWGIKWALVFGIAIGLSLVLYDLCVRSTFIGATLNGQRKNRSLFAVG
ncbi:acyltransferase family protein [Gilvimarinus agarilyticus]|uniref:acyltransferase family protein n=1 Tax=Gilvimarinus sp. 2_MG-2023 TaxID=3062666 RepID=UPI001C093BEA|nr:acyltransferase family protein [Gilvimarinus sp. 2_MG-2023]MBU2887492.1 acyltransferase family protein [Gilvimarinus agarilyticus]MDO6572143.1 acyltransferase family protein [Gilvimarinus sp. 2_MG-2023]